jgi:uncharacterized protein (DUF952 family)
VSIHAIRLEHELSIRFTFPIPIPASHQLILPQLDLDDGFVHTSSALQTPDTLRLFFKDIEGVWILKINAERLANWRKIDWVQGSGVDTNEKGTFFSLLFSGVRAE